MKKIYIYPAVLLALLLFSFTGLMAQGTNASITGRVVDSEDKPVLGATVEVKNESTGFSTGAVIDAQGDYTIRQLPLGGPYTITVSFIGYGTQEQTGFTIGQGDVLRLDFTLQEESIHLDAVKIVGTSLRQGIDRLGSATTLTPSDMQTLPVNGRNFTSLMALSPLSSGSNLMGQLGSSTSYTIDGMNARSMLSSGTTNWGPYLVSMEAIREFEVVTNDYDVTLGRAGGGTISSVTQSGTNTLHGSAYFYHRNDKLQSQYNIDGSRRTADFRTSQFGASLGGPIIKNKLHYFVNWEHQSNMTPLRILDIQDATQLDDEKRYGISKENLERFLQIARDKYGVSDSPQVGQFDRSRQSNTVFARIDWQINPTNLLSIRENFNRDVNPLSESDNNTHIYETYGSHVSQDNSLLASLRSVLGPRLLNEAKFQYVYNKEDGQTGNQIPEMNIPRAIVDITSDIDGDGDPTTRSFQIGGHRYLPEVFIHNQVQFVDQLYYSTNKFNFTFGTDVMYTHLNSMATSEMNGRFTYASLEDFENNRPSGFHREVPVGGIENARVKQGVLNAALYAQMNVSLFPGGQIDAGIRADYTGYFNNPIDDPLLTKELGLHTNNKLKALQVQPRMQFTWDINEKQTDIIRVGAGIFGSNMNNYAMINNLEFDGQRVVTFSRFVDPASGEELGIIPDFPGYRRDPSTIPGEELFAQFGLPRVATYNINGADVKNPVVYKSSLSYNHFFSDRLRLGVTLYGTWARNNYFYADANMVDEPFFRLENEGGRGVYVPAETIAENGATNWMNGKKSDLLGRVLEMNSDGKINNYSIVVDGTWNYWRDGSISASYTWNSSRENTSYNGNVANSATLFQYVIDDPRDLSYMTPSSGFRHKIVFYGSSPTWKGFSIGVRYSGMGGSRYSLLVSGPSGSGGVNGDFVNNNDLAYVFDPNDPNTPAHIAEGINNLLNNPDVAEGYKDYLRASFGKVAERNGGINGLSGQWDVRISKRFNFYKSHGMELSIDIFNVANLIDKTKGSDKNTLGNQTLMTIKGFDRTTKQFDYNVGSSGVARANGTPWQIQFGLKYSF